MNIYTYNNCIFIKEIDIKIEQNQLFKHKETSNTQHDNKDLYLSKPFVN